MSHLSSEQPRRPLGTMPERALLDEVRADLEWLAEYWPDLLEARLPGTGRAWRYEPLTPHQRARRDAELRAERAERSPLAWGEAPAPLDLGVLHVVLQLLTMADDLAAVVAEHTGAPPLTLDRNTFAAMDARPYLAYVCEHLTDDLAEQIAPITARMVQRAAETLGLVHDGQTLRVVCPWCRGVTPETPAGGAYTWRVRELPGGQVAIVCESGCCEPPLQEVGTWWRGRPCWPMSEWERLARLVRASEPGP